MESTVLASKSSWMQRQAEPLQRDEGAGRTGHIATLTPWLQRLVINGNIKMTPIGGSDNCADLGTKHFDCRTMNTHLKFCGMRFAEGRSRIAPRLEHQTEVDSDEHLTGGSRHSAATRHEEGLSAGYCSIMDMETCYGDTRRTLGVATQLGQQPRKEVYVNPNRNTLSE